MITASVMSVASQSLYVNQRTCIPLAVKNYYKKYKKDLNVLGVGGKDLPSDKTCWAFIPPPYLAK